MPVRALQNASNDVILQIILKSTSGGFHHENNCVFDFHDNSVYAKYIVPESATTEYDISPLGTAMHVYRLPFRVECTVCVGLHLLTSMHNYKWE